MVRMSLNLENWDNICIQVCGVNGSINVSKTFGPGPNPGAPAHFFEKKLKNICFSQFFFVYLHC